MAHIFLYRGKIHSVSDRNIAGEYVVVKMNKNKEEVEGVKVIPAKSEKHVEQLIKTYNFENFKNLPAEVDIK